MVLMYVSTDNWNYPAYTLLLPHSHIRHIVISLVCSFFLLPVTPILRSSLSVLLSELTIFYYSYHFFNHLVVVCFHFSSVVPFIFSTFIFHVNYVNNCFFSAKLTAVYSPVTIKSLNSINTGNISL